jgi:hypothetical protein
MKDMFGFEIKEKKARGSRGGYMSCRWMAKVEDQTNLKPCGKDLLTDEQRERGLCERHLYCADAKIAKTVWYGVKR